MRVGIRVLALLAALSWGRSSFAQSVPSLDFRGFTPPTDPNGGLYTEPVATPGPLAWNALVYGSYAHRSVVLEDADGNELLVPVEHQFSVDYGFGVGLGDRVALGVLLPTVVYQTGDDASGVVDGAAALPKAALGDVALSAKAVLLPSGALGGFSLGALGRVTVPTGDEESYISEHAATGEVRLLAELNLLALSVRATAGVKVRGDERTYVNQRFGHELPWGAAIVLRPQPLGWDDQGRWQWALESRGAVSLSPDFADGDASSATFGAYARYTPGAISLLAGAELPLSSGVGTPAVRGVIGIGWAPRFHDADKDGVEDEKDLCPELPEDRDGFDDGDGCPDFDDDDDGVVDESDKCPKQKEDTDEFEDEDGCLDPDDDHDGIPDAADACPREAGPESKDPKRNGCSRLDADVDGVFEPDDRCPEQPEDRDGFEDQDGCPDADNDADRVVDAEDACPDVAGVAREDPKLNGCPTPDRDGDSYDDAEDRCPEAAETFDGVDDADGCPEPAGARPRPELVTWDEATRSFAFARPLAFQKAPADLELTPDSVVQVRAVAKLLVARPELVALVGVRPRDASAAAQQLALNQSFTIVLALRRFAHSDAAAESVSFAAVKGASGAARSGVGVRALGGAATQKPAGVSR